MGELWSMGNYHCIISLARKANMKYCEEVFQALKADPNPKCKPDLLCYNLMIFGYAKQPNGGYDRAKAIEREMNEAGIQSDAATYSGLIYAQGK